MGFEYKGPPRPQQEQYQVAHAQASPPQRKYAQPDSSSTNDDATQKRLPAQEGAAYQEPSYREHVTAPAFYPVVPYYPYPPSTPNQPPVQPAYHSLYPAYPGFPPQPGSQAPTIPDGQAIQPYPAYAGGYQATSNWHAAQPYPAYPGYYSYPSYAYPHPTEPAKPKRDTYLLVISILAFSGSILAVLGGLISGLLLVLVSLVPNTAASDDQVFSGIVLFIALTAIGLVGGSFCLYHSIRSLFLRKPSAQFRLPWFWTFLVLYLGVITTAIIMHINNQTLTNRPLTIILIAMAGFFPAMTILALGVRRLHYPQTAEWPTTWRRITVAVVSGGTSAIIFAMILEFILQIIVVVGLRVRGFSLDNLDSVPHDPTKLLVMFTILSVIAPLVEETVKPLAVVTLIGRMRSASEAFILGLACGIGFDLIETSGYIGMGYKDWLTVAIERSSAGLLHGFGAGMVALGWYYLTHKNSAPHRILLGLGCGAYAVLQHAIWNGSFLLALLPAPLGPYLENGTVKVPLGSLSFSFESLFLVYIVETALMLTFFLFVTGKLRGKKVKPSRATNASEEQGFSSSAYRSASKAGPSPA